MYYVWLLTLTGLWWWWWWQQQQRSNNSKEIDKRIRHEQSTKEFSIMFTFLLDHSRGKFEKMISLDYKNSSMWQWTIKSWEESFTITFYIVVGIKQWHFHVSTLQNLRNMCNCLFNWWVLYLPKILWRPSLMFHKLMWAIHLGNLSSLHQSTFYCFLLKFG